MKYTLLPFQAKAGGQLDHRLDHALRAWRDGRNSPQSIALSAITGAGKTVIATAVIERALTEHPDVVFVWVTDDPALNRQTATKMLRSSTIDADSIVILEPDFDEALLSPGTVYLLNIQRLGANSSMVKTSETRRHSLLDTLEATAKADDRTLVLVADEAHRGMKPMADRSTIMQRLVTTPMPVVWGISATLERFETTMAHMGTHVMAPTVTVDNEDVRASGLLKHNLILARPDAAADLVTLREGVRRFVEVEHQWAEVDESVIPALIVQVEDKIVDADIERCVTAIREELDVDLHEMVNVFGEHQPIALPGGGLIRYVAPESIADDASVRVIFAKEAITTGWDCPRAEVLISMRAAKDATHIAQLLGRIVRAPLTRSVDEAPALNSVYAFLPKFHAGNLKSVVERLGDGGTDEIGVTVSVDSVTVSDNGDISPNVRECLSGLTSLVAPNTSIPAPKRAFDLATMLSSDGIEDGAVSALGEQLCSALDAHRGGSRLSFRAERRAADMVTVRTTTFDLEGREDGSELSYLAADDELVDAAFAASAATLPQGLHQTYLSWLLADGAGEEGESSDEEIHDAMLDVIAVSRMDGVLERIEDECTEYAADRLNAKRSQIRALPASRREDYDALAVSGGAPHESPLVVPEETVAPLGKLVGSEIVEFETFDKHVLSDASGQYPCATTSWEREVLEHELSQPGVLGWYRNPSRPSDAALQVATTSDVLLPDFIFVYDSADGPQAALIDPHSTHLADALEKLCALADYAEAFGDDFVRIEAIGSASDERDAAKVYLDLLDEATRNRVREATSAAELYAEHGRPYAH